MSHIYLGYALEDVELASAIRTLLERNYLKTWNGESYQPGTSIWIRAREKARESADAIVVILTPNAKFDRWILETIQYAQKNSIKLQVLLAEGEPETAVPLGSGLLHSGWIDVRGEEVFETGTDELLKTLQEYLSLIRSPRSEQIQQQLEIIVSHIPTTFMVAIVEQEGEVIALHETGEHFKENRNWLLAYAAQTLGERILTTVDGSDLQLVSLTGSSKTLFFIVLEDRYILVLGVQETTVVDPILALLKQWWTPLLVLLGIPSETQQKWNF